MSAVLRIVAILLFGIVGLPAAAQDGSSDYRVNPGDALSVSVFGEENLERQVLVLPDGTISFPLAGQVPAAGQTTGEIERALAQRLERYVPDAAVTVAVQNAAGNKIYVLGEVNRPGEYQITRPLDVMQALSLAGGLTAFASQNGIQILRREGEEQVAQNFRYGDVKEGRNLGTNVRLQSGDVIVVPGTSLF
jgi:polysaccharide export outer membrane protein